MLSNRLYSQVKELGVEAEIKKFTDFVNATFLDSGSLHMNAISSSSLSRNKTLHRLILNNLTQEDVSTDLRHIFLTLIEKKDETISRELALISRTGFISLIVTALLLGYITELSVTKPHVLQLIN